MPTPDGQNEPLERKHAEELAIHERVAVVGGLLTAKQIMLQAPTFLDGMHAIDAAVQGVIEGDCSINIVQLDEDEVEMMFGGSDDSLT